MSRHEFPACRLGAETIAVGWDRPLATFFITAFGPVGAHGDRTIIEWLGTERRELTRVADVLRLAGRYADLPEGIGRTLQLDRLKTLGTPDGPAQQQAPRF